MNSKKSEIIIEPKNKIFTTFVDIKMKNKQKKVNKENIIKKSMIAFHLFFIIYVIIFTKNKKAPTPNIIVNKNPINIQANRIEQILLELEQKMPHLKEINKKRTFTKRLPLEKSINCQPHFRTRELIAFMSFLTKNNTFFETGSGCSTIMAKYYSKKVYSLEGCKEWYKIGIKNGLKDNIIFKDLKVDDPKWSYPGNKTNLNDWKNFFQSYKKEYNADVILLDGRFKTATALDIFNKIRNDTIVLIHEYSPRPIYFIIEEYYQYIYHWDTLAAFIKKEGIKEIPLEVQKKYWNNFD